MPTTVPRYYAPADTWAEFHAKRPKKTRANYQTYLKYLKQKRPNWDRTHPYRRQENPAWNPPAAAGNGQANPLGLPLNYNSLLKFAWSGLETPKQIEARANRMAQTQMDYQRQLLDEEYGQTREDAMRQMEAFQAAGRAAAAMNAELMGRVGGAYRGGAGEISGLAGALGAAAAGATAADVAAANTALGAVGAPNVVVGGPVGQPGIAGAQQAGVEIYRGGTLPANQMGAASVAGELGIGGLIQSQNLRATQEAQAGFIQATREADRNKARAIRELAAGRPAVAMQFLENLQNAQRNQMVLAQSLIAAKNAQKTQNLQNTLAVKEFNIKMKQVDPVKSEAFGVVTYVNGFQPKDKEGNPIPVSRLYTAEQLQAIRASKAGVAAANRKLTLEELAAQVQWNEVDIPKSISGPYLINKLGKVIKGPDGQPISSAVVKQAQLGSGKGGGGLTAGQKIERLMNAQKMSKANYDDGLDYTQAVKQLTHIGLSKRLATEIANGYYFRGDTGRPLFNAAESKKATQTLGGMRFRSIVAYIEKLLNENSDESEDKADAIIKAVLAGGKNDDYNLFWIFPKLGGEPNFNAHS